MNQGGSTWIEQVRGKSSEKNVEDEIGEGASSRAHARKGSARWRHRIGVPQVNYFPLPSAPMIRIGVCVRVFQRPDRVDSARLRICIPAKLPAENRRAIAVAIFRLDPRHLSERSLVVKNSARSSPAYSRRRHCPLPTEFSLKRRFRRTVRFYGL